MAFGKPVKVIFLPGGETVEVPPGTSLLEAGRRAEVDIWSPCGGQGKCGQCKVQVDFAGPSPPLHPDEERHLSADERGRGLRLACRTTVDAGATVHLPAPMLGGMGRILAAGERRSVPRKPNVRRAVVAAPPPTLADQADDLRRVERTLGLAPDSLSISREAAQELPQVLREHGFGATMTLVATRVVEAVPPDDGAACFGVAFDIGTTTVVGYLLDLQTGEELAAASALNTQQRHGDDVISRLTAVREHPGRLPELRELVLGVVDRLIGQLCQEAGASPERIYEATFVGNATMLHLLRGVDPSAIAVTPFTPVVTRSLTLTPAEAAVGISPRGSVYLLPHVAGYVGADIVGAMVATALDERPCPAMLVDIGTNGEVALWTGTQLLCCSCAAGPAFEGAQIERGTRAIPGAVERVALQDGDVSLTTVANEPAVGVCGSGLVDAVAMLLDAGAMDSTGRLQEGTQTDGLPPAIAARLSGAGRDTRFALVREAETGDGRPLWLTQRDLRQLQLAKAAVRAGIEILLARAGMRYDDLGELLLAGAFGSYIRRRSAVRIGLLPPVPLDRIRAVGNAAGVGSELALISTDVRAYAERLARQAQYVELSAAAEFESVYTEAMLFPEAAECGEGIAAQAGNQRRARE